MVPETVPAAEPESADAWVYTGFDDFVRLRSPALCRTAFLLTGDHHHAEDAVQTALAKVAGRWDRIVAGGDPMPYVRTAVLRSAIASRRRRWWGEVPTAPLPDTIGAGDPAAIAARDRLRRALLQVPSRQRAALVLRFYDDLSEQDTATALGCSVGTVKSQTAKGLARLRAVLAGETTNDDTDTRETGR